MKCAWLHSMSPPTNVWTIAPSTIISLPIGLVSPPALTFSTLPTWGSIRSTVNPVFHLVFAACLLINVCHVLMASTYLTIRALLFVLIHTMRVRQDIVSPVYLHAGFAKIRRLALLVKKDIGIVCKVSVLCNALMGIMGIVLQKIVNCANHHA